MLPSSPASIDWCSCSYVGSLAPTEPNDVFITSFTLLVNLPIALAKDGLGHVWLDLCFAAALTASAMIMAADRR